MTDRATGEHGLRADVPLERRIDDDLRGGDAGERADDLSELCFSRFVEDHLTFFVGIERVGLFQNIFESAAGVGGKFFWRS